MDPWRPTTISTFPVAYWFYIFGAANFGSRSVSYSQLSFIFSCLISLKTYTQKNHTDKHNTTVDERRGRISAPCAQMFVIVTHSRVSQSCRECSHIRSSGNSRLWRARAWQIPLSRHSDTVILWETLHWDFSLLYLGLQVSFCPYDLT